MYTRHTSSIIMLIILYVDDMLIAANDSATIVQIKGEFRKSFEIKYVVDVSVCFELEIHLNRANHTLLLSQNSYIDTVLELFGMHTTKPVFTYGYFDQANALSRRPGSNR